MGFSGWDIAGLRAWNFPTEGAPERTFPWSPFNMIKTLWARVSKMWLLGELGMGFFYSAPQGFVMLGVFCARFPPREASIYYYYIRGNSWRLLAILNLRKIFFI